MALGERIKLARRMAGLSQRDLAANAGVSAQAISKYEREQDVPGSPVLLRLAAALNVRLDFLLRPGREVPIALDFRTDHPLSRKQQQAIQAAIRDWLDRYLDIEELTGESRPFTWPSGFPRSVSTPGEAEQAAAALREAWNVGLDPIEDMTELLEDKGIKIGIIPNAPAKFDACSTSAGADGRAPVIAAGDGFPGDRQRFNLAHELAHLVLLLPAGLQGEHVAHRFAGAFLVPESAVRAELGERRRDLHVVELQLLKRKYGASMQCWIHRAEELHVLPRAAAKRLRAGFSSNEWRETEPGEQYERETPTRMRRLVMRALAEDLISESRAAELLDMPASDFRRMLGEVYAVGSSDRRSGQQHLDRPTRRRHPRRSTPAAL